MYSGSHCGHPAYLLLYRISAPRTFKITFEMNCFDPLGKVGSLQLQRVSTVNAYVYAKIHWYLYNS